MITTVYNVLSRLLANEVFTVNQ